MKTKTDRKRINFGPFLERFRKNRFAPRPEVHIESLEPCHFFAFCHVHWLLCSPHFRSVGKESLFMKDWCHLSFMKVKVVIFIIAIKNQSTKKVTVEDQLTCLSKKEILLQTFLEAPCYPHTWSKPLSRTPENLSNFKIHMNDK